MSSTNKSPALEQISAAEEVPTKGKAPAKPSFGMYQLFKEQAASRPKLLPAPRMTTEEASHSPASPKEAGAATTASSPSAAASVPVTPLGDTCGHILSPQDRKNTNKIELEVPPKKRKLTKGAKDSKVSPRSSQSVSALTGPGESVSIPGELSGKAIPASLTSLGRLRGESILRIDLPLVKTTPEKDRLIERESASFDLDREPLEFLLNATKQSQRKASKDAKALRRRLRSMEGYNSELQASVNKFEERFEEVAKRLSESQQQFQLESSNYKKTISELVMKVASSESQLVAERQTFSATERALREQIRVSQIFAKAKEDEAKNLRAELTSLQKAMATMQAKN